MHQSESQRLQIDSDPSERNMKHEQTGDHGVSVCLVSFCVFVPAAATVGGELGD